MGGLWSVPVFLVSSLHAAPPDVVRTGVYVHTTTAMHDDEYTHPSPGFNPAICSGAVWWQNPGSDPAIFVMLLCLICLNRDSVLTTHFKYERDDKRINHFH
ncbi:unnamed protein product, partial [Laminaria digitata]